MHPRRKSALLVNQRRFISSSDLFPLAPANRPWVSEDEEDGVAGKMCFSIQMRTELPSLCPERRRIALSLFLFGLWSSRCPSRTKCAAKCVTILGQNKEILCLTWHKQGFASIVVQQHVIFVIFNHSFVELLPTCLTRFLEFPYEWHPFEFLAEVAFHTKASTSCFCD